VRFTVSGTEATMSAIRLARGFTSRESIIKFEGCYHGHSDGLLVKAGSGGATFGVASSAGVPKGYSDATIPLPFNDLKAVEETFQQEKIAAVIIEPVPGNMGVVPPAADFLQGLRKLCTQHDALLIFDEVMCGFRVSASTAAALFKVQPDLFCFGKVIGGGLPVGAFGGRREIMDNLAPAGPVYQAGTLSGNPLAMRAGLKTLQIYTREGGFAQIEKLSAYLQEGMSALCEKYNGISFRIIGSMFTLFFKNGHIRNMDDVNGCDFDKFGRFFNFMLNCFYCSKYINFYD